jgi:hypothetical protein
MEKFAIGANLESAAARRNEGKRLDALAEFENFGRQTDGLRRVVSNDAVFDRHLSFHLELLSRNQRIGVKKGGQGVESIGRLRDPSHSLGMTSASKRGQETVTAAARSRILLLAELLRTRKLLEFGWVSRRFFLLRAPPFKSASTNCYVTARRRN